MENVIFARGCRIKEYSVFRSTSELVLTGWICVAVWCDFVKQCDIMQIENYDERCCFGTRYLYYDESSRFKSDRRRCIGRGGGGETEQQLVWNFVSPEWCDLGKPKMKCWGHYMNNEYEYIQLFIAFVSNLHWCKWQFLFHLCFFVAVWCYKAVLFISAAVTVSGAYTRGCW